MKKKLLALLSAHKVKVSLSILLIVISSSYKLLLNPNGNKYQIHILNDKDLQKSLGEHFNPLLPDLSLIRTESYNSLIASSLNKAIRNIQLNKYSNVPLFLLMPSIANNPDANYILGTMFANGQGVKQNFLKAEQYLQKASIKNHAESQFYLCYIFDSILMLPNTDSKIRSEAISARNSYLHRSAINGYDKAQYILGTFYEDGTLGETDLEEALKWYKAAATQGHEDALNAYGQVTSQLAELERLRQETIAYQQRLRQAANERYIEELEIANKKAKRKKLIKNTAAALAGAGLITGAVFGIRAASRR